MPKNRIDVVMSVFNGARTIERAIDSIRNQTIRDIRIIVVDDGSTDDTGIILRRIASDDGRLLVLSKPNSGIVDSLEMGLSHCKAAFVARHDADDISDALRFETQMHYLVDHPDCVAVSGGARYIDAADVDTGRRAKIVDLAAADAEWVPAREPYLMQPFLMVRRDALIEAGGYRPLHVAEDSDLCWRLRDVGRLHNIDRLFGDYRVHDDSISSGSIVNGRMIALYSQLVALSARRRMKGLEDIKFERSDYAIYSRALTMQDLHSAALVKIDAEESVRLRLAMAAKLLEVCFYRNFDLARDDCIFVRTAIRDGNSLMSSPNRALLSQSIMETALRLATAGRVSDAAQLLTPHRRAVLAMRLSFRLGLHPALRAKLRNLRRLVGN